MKKFVLTGGPCTGKTTLLEELGKRGFQIVPEVPRLVMKEEQSKGGSILPWIDLPGFEKIVFERQVEFESKLNDRPEAFLDRGIPDILSYHKVNSLAPPEELIRSAERNKYDGVFLLDKLPFFENDPERKEDPEMAEKIHQTIRETYGELGYDVIDVPPLSIEERAKFIIEKLSL